MEYKCTNNTVLIYTSSRLCRTNKKITDPLTYLHYLQVLNKPTAPCDTYVISIIANMKRELIV